MARVATQETDWRSVLEQRLQCVLTALVRLKQEKSGQRELHEARVACRRAEAALRLCRDLLPAKSTRSLSQDIRTLRHSTNATRDQDVLRHWLKTRKGSATRTICRTLKQQREDQLAQLNRTLGNLHQLRKHLSHISRSVQNESPMEWQSCQARRLLQDVLRFLRCIPRSDTDIAGLHEFRIAAKRLRYECELATEVIPNMNFRSMLQRLKQMQVRLGQIHDTAARIEQLKQLDKSVRSSWLRASRREQLLLIQEWTSWWRSVPWENAIGSAITQLVRAIRGS